MHNKILVILAFICLPFCVSAQQQQSRSSDLKSAVNGQEIIQEKTQVNQQSNSAARTIQSTVETTRRRLEKKINVEASQERGLTKPRAIDSFGREVHSREGDD